MTPEQIIEEAIEAGHTARRTVYQLAAKGFVIVPAEPTPEMMNASYAPRGNEPSGWPSPHTNADKYRAMIAAAPPAMGRTVRPVSETVSEEQQHDAG